MLIRRALIGSPLVEVSGSIGSVYSFLILYAFGFRLVFKAKAHPSKSIITDYDYTTTIYYYYNYLTHQLAYYTHY